MNPARLLTNPKSEYRNPKQIQNSNFQMAKTQRLNSSISNLEFGSFDIVLDLGFRASDFISPSGETNVRSS
jgi:hypothetical protein